MVCRHRVSLVWVLCTLLTPLSAIIIVYASQTPLTSCSGLCENSFIVLFSNGCGPLATSATDAANQFMLVIFSDCIGQEPLFQLPQSTQKYVLLLFTAVRTFSWPQSASQTYCNPATKQNIVIGR